MPELMPPPAETLVLPAGQRINIHWPGPTTSVRITRTVVAPVQCSVWLAPADQLDRLDGLWIGDYAAAPEKNAAPPDVTAGAARPIEPTTRKRGRGDRTALHASQ